MLHESPMYSDMGANLPTWYITTLLLSGFLLYYLLQKKIGVELLLLSMVGYGWLTTRYGTVDLVFDKYSGLLLLARGFCGLSLGAGLAMLKERVSLSSKTLRIIDIVALYALFAFCCLCYSPSPIMDSQAILLAAIVVFVCFQPNSLINRVLNVKWFASLGSISFYMLLVHSPICRAIEFVLNHSGNLSLSYIFLTIIYLVAVLACSYALRWLEHFIRRITCAS